MKKWIFSIQKSVTLTVLFNLVSIVLVYSNEYIGLEGAGGQIKYQTYFGNCPSRAAGVLTLKLVKTFEKNSSLKDVKKKILEDSLFDKHFLSSYKLKFDPLRNLLKIYYDCPKPLMKAQVYKENGLETYTAILVENGQLFDPTYEILLRSEKKLNEDLPFLALPIREIDKKVQVQIAALIKELDLDLRGKISEIILSDEGELTMILSVSSRPSSVFLGNDQWEEKTTKLKKIIDYMESKKRIPAIINLTSSKKVVVKFSDKF